MSLSIAGYAALFDIPDGARDVIVRGAFSRSLAQRREPIPLYWQHRPEQRIGTVSLIEEDDRGLRVIATIDNPGSRAVAALLARETNGLSFGYRARGYRPMPDTGSGAGRVLEDIDLFEISLVTHPLQHGARVHMVQ
ncbi:HK97 family phage prohead protease [Alteraurantiacibacter aestuarii]